MTSSSRRSDTVGAVRPTRVGGRARWLLRSGWLIVVCAAICGLVVGYGLTLRVHPTFSAKATLYVTPPTSSSATDAVAGDQYAFARAQLYEQMASDEELGRRVATALQTPDPPAEVAKRVTITSSHDAPLLTIEARGRSPQEARSLAQAYLDQLPDFARSVEQSSGLREGPVLVTVAAPASVVPSATTGKPWLLFVVPCALSIGLALIFILIRNRRNPTVNRVNRLRTTMPTHLVVKLTGKPEQLARIQSILYAARNPARRLIIASARRDDGVDATILNLRRSLLRGMNTEVFDEQRTSTGTRLNNAIIVSAPALLDESERISDIATRADSAVIVCRRRRTRERDVQDLAALLSSNGIELRGILIAGRRRLTRQQPVTVAANRHGETEQPWPRIDVLEADTNGTSTERMQF